MQPDLSICKLDERINVKLGQCIVFFRKEAHPDQLWSLGSFDHCIFYRPIYLGLGYCNRDVMQFLPRTRSTKFPFSSFPPICGLSARNSGERCMDSEWYFVVFLCSTATDGNIFSRHYYLIPSLGECSQWSAVINASVRYVSCYTTV